MNDPPVSSFIGIVLMIIAVCNYILRVIILPKLFVFNKTTIQQ